MGLLRKVTAPQQARQPTAPPTAAEMLQQVIKAAGKASLFAYSDLVKKVDCSRCGAPKQLPSRTAYLYCDHCGSLVDYDFRLANLGTNAGYTNTVYRQVVAPDARAVVCESCGRKLDIAGGQTPCQTCGAPLSFPVGVSRLECPYCQSETHRI